MHPTKDVRQFEWKAVSICALIQNFLQVIYITSTLTAVLCIILWMIESLHTMWSSLCIICISLSWSDLCFNGLHVYIFSWNGSWMMSHDCCESSLRFLKFPLKAPLRLSWGGWSTSRGTIRRSDLLEWEIILTVISTFTVFSVKWRIWRKNSTARYKHGFCVY